MAVVIIIVLNFTSVPNKEASESSCATCGSPPLPKENETQNNKSSPLNLLVFNSHLHLYWLLPQYANEL